MRLKISLVRIHSEKRGLAFARIDRKTPLLRPEFQSNQSSFLCSFHGSRDRGRKRPNGQIVGIKGRKAGRSLMKREKVQDQERILAEHLDGLERSDFCNFEKPHKHVYQKGKIESNEQSKKEDQPKYVCRKWRNARLRRKLLRR